jgi:hypothetical protein
MALKPGDLVRNDDGHYLTFIREAPEMGQGFVLLKPMKHHPQFGIGEIPHAYDRYFPVEGQVPAEVVEAAPAPVLVPAKADALTQGDLFG